MVDWSKNDILDTDQGEISQRGFWFVTRGLAIGLGVLTFHEISPAVMRTLELNPYSTDNQLLATSIFASSLLTFALLSVYRDIGGIHLTQAKIQDRQTDIQERQASLMEANNKPKVVVSDWSVSDEDEASFTLSNIGNGVATDLELVIHIDKIGDTNPIRETVTTEIEESTSGGGSEISKSGPTTHENYIEEGNHNLRYESQTLANLWWEDPPKSYDSVNFSEAVDRLLDNEEEPIFLSAILIYSDLSDNQYEQPLLNEVIYEPSGKSFHECMKTDNKTLFLGVEFNPPDIHPSFDEDSNIDFTLPGDDDITDLNESWERESVED